MTGFLYCMLYLLWVTIMAAQLNAVTSKSHLLRLKCMGIMSILLLAKRYVIAAEPNWANLAVFLLLGLPSGWTSTCLRIRRSRHMPVLRDVWVLSRALPKLKLPYAIVLAGARKCIIQRQKSHIPPGLLSIAHPAAVLRLLWCLLQSAHFNYAARFAKCEPCLESSLLFRCTLASHPPWPSTSSLQQLACVAAMLQGPPRGVAHQEESSPSSCRSDISLGRTIFEHMD